MLDHKLHLIINYSCDQTDGIIYGLLLSMIITDPSLNFITCPPIQTSPLSVQLDSPPIPPLLTENFQNKTFSACDRLSWSRIVFVKMQTAGRIFPYTLCKGNKNLVGKGFWFGEVGHFLIDKEEFLLPSPNGKTVLISFPLLQYIKVTYAALSVTAFLLCNLIQL